MSLNRVCMIGRLTRDPELRTTTTGKSVVEFSIAVNKKFKPTDGGPDADFFRCKAWGSTAEFVANYLSKGRLIAVHDARNPDQASIALVPVRRDWPDDQKNRAIDAYIRAHNLERWNP